MKCQNVKNCGHLVLENSARLNKEHVWELDYALFRKRMLLHSLGYVLLDRGCPIFSSHPPYVIQLILHCLPLYYTLALTRSMDYCKLYFLQEKYYWIIATLNFPQPR